MKRNKAWSCVVTACLASVMLLSVVPAAQAHGDERLLGEVEKNTRDGEAYIFGWGGIETRRVHHRVHVRTCLDRFGGPPNYSFYALKCVRHSRPSTRGLTLLNSVKCNADDYYRVRVRGWVTTASGQIQHRMYAASTPKFIDCPG